ncbi:hypothetical protein M758_1G107200 [Ceratodon purpureus]|uniref:Uncharacterized protein n=1 Tax=Ceratodon purpureus TaxID=3225 RepID=A0A8T0J497_CERPU|nr:hypothetical protein KC19_1G099700 [Ceratodon purpureus]KAG0629480.1 hypothetical protein M758_1G107200 [Ceratodon purpureus]
MASVLRQRFGAFRIRTGLPTISQQHPVHSPSLIAKRFMGGHGGDDVEETFKWRNVTIACVIGLIPMMFSTLSGDEEHHHEERPAYSYLRIRNKEFPWGPNGLFEYDD